MKKSESKPQITSAFGRIFRKIKKNELFESPPLNELQERMFDAFVTAALAKCVQFNIAVNRSRKNSDEYFLAVSNLRGICEDLIILSYASRMNTERRRLYISLLLSQTQADGMDVQEAFFGANNPYQPVFGQRNHPMLSPRRGDGEPLPSRRDAVRGELRDFWMTGKKPRKKGPTVKEMASDIGLGFTYDYIYFAASNFVHFNPQAMLKMGWGNSRGPFRFSVETMGPYYKSLSSFYGSILFIGFQSAFGHSHLSASTNMEVNRLIELIEMVRRWPEVITFEEMNRPVPAYIISHALRMATPDGAPEGVLSEVRNLGMKLKEIDI